MSGAGFDFLHIVRRCSRIDKLGDASNFKGLIELIFLGGRGNGNPESGVGHASQQVGNRRERPHQRQIRRPEALAAPFLKFRAVIPLFVGRKEDRNQLVSSFADLASSLVEAHIMTELEHRLLPCEGVEVHRVQQRAVQVEDRGFRQFHILQVLRCCSRLLRALLFRLFLLLERHDHPLTWKDNPTRRRLFLAQQLSLQPTAVGASQIDPLRRILKQPHVGTSRATKSWHAYRNLQRLLTS